MGSILDSIPWARRLKIRHLEVFVVLHEMRSLTDAASRLHMTQPALSHWLADMESTVGRALFVRDRKLSLTPDGQVLLAHAERMLGDVQRTHLELQAVQGGMRGRLHVGTGLPRILLPGAISRLHQARPDVFVSVTEAAQPQLLGMLARCEVDALIGVMGTEVLQSGFACEGLMSDCVQIVARRDHPLTRQGPLTLQDTLACSWILPPGNSVMRAAFDDSFAQAGVRPPMACVEGNSSVRMQLLVCAPNYLSIFTASELKGLRSDEPVVALPLTASIPFPDIGTIWSPQHAGPIVMGFLEAVRFEARSVRGSEGNMPA